MDSDAARTKELMEEFAQNGKIDLSGYQDQIRRDFVAASVSEGDCSGDNQILLQRA